MHQIFKICVQMFNYWLVLLMLYLPLLDICGYELLLHLISPQCVTLKIIVRQVTINIILIDQV